ncbi:hypothetical protein JCM11491_004994 [Sporobolomyces phaffii]
MAAYRDKERTRFSWWTPACAALERGAFPILSSSPSSRLVLTLYRSLRVAYVVVTIPFHLVYLVLSLPPLALELPTSPFDPEWTPAQKLVYPFLRRIIWALADVGDPNVLTRSTDRGDVPWWALALEQFTVSVGRGAKVDVTEQQSVTQPATSIPTFGTGIEPGKVNLFWYERRNRHASRRIDDEWYRPRERQERIVLYLFGGGFVCGSPGEGGRCYKIARETGLRVVGVNYRRAIDPTKAFPAALQDVVTAYSYLVDELGFRDIVLAGDSAGGGLALNVVQYLAVHVFPQPGAPRERENFVLPSALLLISPWCDLTLESFPEADKPNQTDIILPSICSNSTRAYLEPLRTAGRAKRAPPFDTVDDVAQHPWFSPSLRSSLPSLELVAKAYGLERRPLRILVTLGTAELFYPSLVPLVDNLRRAARPQGGSGSLVVESIVGKGEVHAFPLVPEWVSPNAVTAWERLRVWFREE